jgi:hypothetical protein
MKDEFRMMNDKISRLSRLSRLKNILFVSSVFSVVKNGGLS